MTKFFKCNLLYSGRSEENHIYNFASVSADSEITINHELF